ncbi:hypothetical protein [Acetohalobium arabaticum]|uniref:Tfp pilus assembly protein PilP n=1 Tax=Acetohalobium arabaticum (strain ATCC 49924 / DSM 5501 / Z-7288) TaxID=574087 RepID=D9QRX4_ACEAZ|nr:hypothetical protein [Acetohalobium arabaticum]ADL13265.1 hypothetical protein Acear_1760 [Acetohalobium arabaticum DSM 5501]
MQFNNLFSSSFIKTKLVLIFASILLSVGCSGFITYQALDLINTKQDIENFKEEIARIVKVQDIEAGLDEDLQEITNGSNQSNVLFSYNNQSNTNPFRSLLTKKVVDKSVASKQDSSTVDKPEIIKPDITVLGILGNQKVKRAIIRLGSSETEVYIVRVKEEIQELKIKSITDNKVIITKQNRDFSYEFGG